MPISISEQTPAASRWTSRLAVFSLVVLLVAAVLHRLGLPTPVAFNMLLMSYAGAFAALVLAIVATVLIWRHGGGGTSRVVMGLLISIGMFGAAAIVLILAGRYPVLNDVSTDVQAPPPFNEIAKLRGPATNSVDYPKNFAAIQTKNYPDLQPLLIGRSRDEAHEVAVEVLKRQHYRIVHEEPAGVIEAVDRSMILGFTDDIAVRVTGDEQRARIDIRSASRFGISDFGHNAGRVRLLLKEIVARFEETVPSADGVKAAAGVKPDKPGAKPEKERGSKKVIQRKSQDRGR
ncbi:MAG: DUF1499 domain-containing protein [Hyphomicrobium sp.]